MSTSEDARTLAMLRTFLDRSHLAGPGQLGEVVLQAGREVGWTVSTYLADYEQRSLVPMPVGNLPDGEVLGIDSTLAGRCFRTVEPVVSHAEGQRAVWLPLVDGAERLGVLHAVIGDADVGQPQEASQGLPDDRLLVERCRLLGHLTGHLVAAKRPYGDGLDRLMRRQPRAVAAELLHQLLPPHTFACEGLVVSGLLQPVYDVAADAYDYAVADDTAHFAILDATGHDLAGTTLTAVALSAYRNGRRQQQGMFASAQAMDDLIAEHGQGWRLASGVLGELDLTSGRLRYLNAGHPAPLLMRDGKVVKELADGRRVLFGLGEGEGKVAEEWLQPGDRIVVYTDGITEARRSDGEFFGLDRLVDQLEKGAATRQPAPETLRRIGRDVLAHQGGALRDDATLLVVEWASRHETQYTSSWTRPADLDELTPSSPGSFHSELPRS